MGIGSYIFFGLMAICFMITIVIVVAVWRGTSAYPMWLGNGKNQFKSWESHHKLVKEMHERQKKLAEDITDLRQRTANIEKILREVE